MIALKLVERTGWIAGISGVVFLAVSYLFNKVFFGLGFLIALLWSVINIYLISLILRGFLDQTAKRRAMAFILLAVKFPLLYGLGYLILRTGVFPLWSVVIGLTYFLISIAIAIWQLRET